MSLLSEVQTRLDAELSSFETVALSWTTQPLEDFNAETPAALYWLDGDASEESPFANDSVQPNDVSVSVIIVCPVADLEPLLAELRAALKGWEPSGNTWDRFEHVAGQNIAIIGGVCWWRDTFTGTNYTRS